MKARRLDNDFELRGKWWIGDGSNLPDDAVSGSLQFERAGDITLTLDGHLAQENTNDHSSRMRSVISAEPFRTPAILGFSPEGERYTLIGVLRTEAMFSMHGYPRSVFEGMSTPMFTTSQREERIPPISVMVIVQRLHQWGQTRLVAWIIIDPMIRIWALARSVSASALVPAHGPTKSAAVSIVLISKVKQCSKRT